MCSSSQIRSRDHGRILDLHDDPDLLEIIMEQRGQVVGHLQEEVSSIHLMNSEYKTLGYHQKNRNTTDDADYKVIGPSNQLGRLLRR